MRDVFMQDRTVEEYLVLNHTSAADAILLLRDRVTLDILEKIGKEKNDEIVSRILSSIEAMDRGNAENGLSRDLTALDVMCLLSDLMEERGFKLSGKMAADFIMRELLK
jgi:hypothetical protein